MTNAKKVYFFENLRRAHKFNGITVNDAFQAWKMATHALGNLKENYIATINAGHEIVENGAGDVVEISETRFEVKLSTGETYIILMDAAEWHARHFKIAEVKKFFNTTNGEEKEFWREVLRRQCVQKLYHIMADIHDEEERLDKMRQEQAALVSLYKLATEKRPYTGKHEEMVPVKGDILKKVA